ncbi:MAG: hypothetical protein ACKPKO_53025, partial [Candidatus Fonsibacter sp.]
LRVVLFTQVRTQYPDREPLTLYEATERRIDQRKRKYDRANHKGMLQYWTGHLTVNAYNDKVISQQKEKLTIGGTNEFKTTVSHLHDRCQLQGTRAQSSGLPLRHLHSRHHGDWRGRLSLGPRLSRR